MNKATIKEHILGCLQAMADLAARFGMKDIQMELTHCMQHIRGISTTEG